MSKALDQVVYDMVFVTCQKAGWRVFDFLPPKGTPYPFIALGEAHGVPVATKERLLGRVYLTVDVWGDASSRKNVSDMCAATLEAVSRWKSNRVKLSLGKSEFRVRPDNTTNESLWHGILNLVFFIL